MSIFDTRKVVELFTEVDAEKLETLLVGAFRWAGTEVGGSHWEFIYRELIEGEPVNLDNFREDVYKYVVLPSNDPELISEVNVILKKPRERKLTGVAKFLKERGM